ncbi:c-type cytochrome [Bowmanella pacifica]|uniref:Cytochrome c n=1 Tax=Bowmanella pacifica TaxID=502051 RepID=A0A918DJD0_9ALTE|nr:c-type cytochrome [Bowmanella pacifica]GGO68263.1 cytochrome c [Bowmanella pacifica]
MPKTVMQLVLIGFAFLSLSVLADPAKVYTTCAACHGDKGQGNPQLQGPVLAGLSGEYLTRQLQAFQQGKRGQHPQDVPGQQMAAMAKSLLSEETDLAALSAYIEQMPLPQQSTRLSGDLKSGNAYYQNNCGACHGGQGQGNPAFQAPRLAGQDSDYLRRQFMYFKRGIRGTDKSDKPGRQMAMMANTLPDDKLNDVLAFIGSL